MLARVGLSEREARVRGVGYRLAKVPMKVVFRAQTLSDGKSLDGSPSEERAG